MNIDEFRRSVDGFFFLLRTKTQQKGLTIRGKLSMVTESDVFVFIRPFLDLNLWPQQCRARPLPLSYTQLLILTNVRHVTTRSVDNVGLECTLPSDDIVSLKPNQNCTSIICIVVQRRVLTHGCNTVLHPMSVSV